MAKLTKDKTYKIELWDRRSDTELYLITWKNKRAESSLVVRRSMPNHLYLLEDLLIDEGYEQTFRSPLLK
jgi:hypothetical protein|tara:strand:+ start:40 stop:249 length:210 start_codon:yes stop_codon:yes gene_type:complete